MGDPGGVVRMTVQQGSGTEPHIAGAVTVAARRIGLIADNHSAQDDGSDLPDEVFRAFDDVDLIVHLGHTGVRERLARGVLDRLEKVAPVLAVRDFSSDKDGNIFLSPSEGDRVTGVTRVVETEGFRIGAIHNLAKEPGPAITAPPGGVPELDTEALNAVLPKKFGGPVDIVAFAGTHRAVVVTADGVLFVNPGSPTYPKGPGRDPGGDRLGTVGILEVHDGVAAYEVIELECLAAEASDPP
jgi:putative phosphoesterase